MSLPTREEFGAFLQAVCSAQAHSTYEHTRGIAGTRSQELFDAVILAQDQVYATYDALAVEIARLTEQRTALDAAEVRIGRLVAERDALRWRVEDEEKENTVAVAKCDALEMQILQLTTERDALHAERDALVLDWMDAHDARLERADREAPASLQDEVTRLVPVEQVETVREAFWLLVSTEVDRAYGKHGSDLWGRHEFYAVMKEEVDEVWEAIKANAPNDVLLKEIVQVAAMCLRYVETGDRYEAMPRPVTHIRAPEAAKEKP